MDARGVSPALALPPVLNSDDTPPLPICSDEREPVSCCSTCLKKEATAVWDEAKSEAQKHRVVVDQVASLTDVSALNLHAELVGK